MVTAEFKKDFLRCYPALLVLEQEIDATFSLFVNCYHSGGKVLVCGNGGSAADAEHIVGELMNKFRLFRPVPLAVREKLEQLGCDNAAYLAAKLQQAIPAISLVSQSALTTAIANDIGPDMIFAQQVYGYGRAGDMLIAISTSGNSGNIIHAAQVARAQGMAVIGLTGEQGGAIEPWCQVCFKAPSPLTYRVQELHVAIYHLLCAMVEEELFGVTHE